jgi:NADH-ubiquinone oxidoreductase chain 4
MILSAAYTLWLYNRVIFGNFKPKFLQKISDLNKREVLIFLPFVVGIIWMGVYLEVFLECMMTATRLAGKKMVLGKVIFQSFL